MTKMTAEGGRQRSFRLHNMAIPARPLEPALYLVATPIGNLGDITLRALETLAGADVLACEDTRVTRVLLDRYGIQNRPYAYHEHNADEAGPRLAAGAGGRQIRRACFRCRHAARLRSRLSPGAAGRSRQAIASFRSPALPRRLRPSSARGCPTMPFCLPVFCRPRTRPRRDRLAEFATAPATLMFLNRRIASRSACWPLPMCSAVTAWRPSAAN